MDAIAYVSWIVYIDVVVVYLMSPLSFILIVSIVVSAVASSAQRQDTCLKNTKAVAWGDGASPGNRGGANHSETESRGSGFKADCGKRLSSCAVGPLCLSHRILPVADSLPPGA
jgi:hypothetical protein